MAEWKWFEVVGLRVNQEREMVRSEDRTSEFSAQSSPRSTLSQAHDSCSTDIRTSVTKTVLVLDQGVFNRKSWHQSKSCTSVKTAAVRALGRDGKVGYKWAVESEKFP